MGAYFYSYSLVNDTIARAVEQLWVILFSAT